MARKSQEALINEAYDATGPANAFIKSLKAGVVNEALAFTVDSASRKPNEVSAALDRRRAPFKAAVAEQAEIGVDIAAGVAAGAAWGAIIGAIVGSFAGGIGAGPGAIIGAELGGGGLGGIMALYGEGKAIGRILTYPLRRMLRATPRVKGA